MQLIMINYLLFIDVCEEQKSGRSLNSLHVETWNFLVSRVKSNLNELVRCIISEYNK